MTESTIEPPRYYQEASWNLAAAIILPIVDTVAVALRFYTRRKQKLSFQTDDWFTIPALILTIAAGVTMICGIAEHAVGYATPAVIDARSLWERSDLADENRAITIVSKVQFAMYLITVPALGFIKLSFLSFYHRIFCVQKRDWSSIMICTMSCITVLWMVAVFFAQLFACKANFSALWGSTIDLETKCFKTFDFLYGTAVSDFLMDLIIIIIPLPLLWRLQLQTRKKLAVSAVFLLGIGAVAASCVRMVVIIKAATVGFDPHADEDYTIVGLLYWILVEAGVGLLASCLPTLSFLFRGISPDAIINSIRNVFSLNSLRSNRSRLYDDSAQVSDGQARASNESRAKIVDRKTKVEISASEFPMTTLRGPENC